ncbi:MAG: pentapeptide repeat-containing protein [Gammaproteobacteria bacterium]|nr:pentapeptide repeat-containing protein [Gammaproteobacteria bacterium]
MKKTVIISLFAGFIVVTLSACATNQARKAVVVKKEAAAKVVALTPVAKSLYRAKRFCQCCYCNLMKADLSNFKPGSQKLSENSVAQIPGQKTAGKDVSDAGWMSCDFVGADMTLANLSNVNFTVAMRGYVTPLAKADFSGAILDRAQLTNAVLYGDNFTYAKLPSADLRNADLSMANFSHALLNKSNMQGAIAKTDAMHGWGVDMRRANFYKANLTGARLYGDFAHAKFNGAILKNAIIDTSPNAIPSELESMVKPKHAWQGVDFSGANLTGAKIKTEGKIIKLEKSGAILCHTIMPDGKINNNNCKKK